MQTGVLSLHERTWDDAREVLEWFRRPPAVPFVVAVNRVVPGDGALVAVMACDVADRASARAVLPALLAEVLHDPEPRIILG